MRTLILSDLHLGSPHCRAAQVLDVLDREPFERLILNGDTINGVHLRRLTSKHWSVIGRLGQLARDRELILMRGNHDFVPGHGPGPGRHDVLSELLGVPMHEEYRLEISGRPYLVLHGDRFDTLLKSPWASHLAWWCYLFALRLNQKFAHWLKEQSRRWGGVLERVRRLAVEYARQCGCAGIVTGHTHYADDVTVDDIHYLNTGCWTEPPCAYGVVESGGVRLHQLPA
jgi:UDP-2,3-diacylglucosamine pyrophosphatase LpxH